MTAPLLFGLTRGEAPLIVSIPHAGTDIPPALESRLASPWLGRRDADWHVRELYAFAADLGGTVIAANLSRTVIDLNRDPSGVSLYPGQATTGLCPAESFDGEPLWRAGREPDPAETAARRAAFFDPYHQALAAEIARLKARHGAVVLWDAHSIRSRIPRLFEGVLPDLNLGTFGGASCDPSLAAAVEAVCAASSFSHVCNGRFKGGWITRRYGRPAEGVHALQMELACRAYLAEPRGPLSPANWPAPFDPVRAAPLAATLRAALAAALEILPALAKDAP